MLRKRAPGPVNEGPVRALTFRRQRERETKNGQHPTQTPVRASSSITNYHRKIRLEASGDALLAVVERHVEQPAAAHFELHETVAGDPGRGRRKAVGGRRPHRRGPPAPPALG